MGRHEVFRRHIQSQRCFGCGWLKKKGGLRHERMNKHVNKQRANLPTPHCGHICKLGSCWLWRGRPGGGGVRGQGEGLGPRPVLLQRESPAVYTTDPSATGLHAYLHVPSPHPAGFFVCFYVVCPMLIVFYSLYLITDNSPNRSQFRIIC